MWLLQLPCSHVINIWQFCCWQVFVTVEMSHSHMTAICMLLTSSVNGEASSCILQVAVIWCFAQWLCHLVMGLPVAIVVVSEDFCVYTYSIYTESQGKLWSRCTEKIQLYQYLKKECFVCTNMLYETCFQMLCTTLIFFSLK